MIGGLGTKGLYPAIPDNATARERPDIARVLSVADDRSRDSRLRIPVSSEPGNDTSSADGLDQVTFKRRVEARQAADESRFERFRSDQVPPGNARALDAFATVAGYRDHGDVELAGIDIHV